jgi:hypothetical protein
MGGAKRSTRGFVARSHAGAKAPHVGGDVFGKQDGEGRLGDDDEEGKLPSSGNGLS